MDFGERRAALARSPRLIALGAANLVAFLVLSSLLYQRGCAGAVDLASGQELAADPGLEAAPRTPEEDERFDEQREGAGGGNVGLRSVDPPRVPTALERRIEAAIAEACAEAARRSNNKVNARTAEVALQVVDTDTGEVLLCRLAERPLRPASVLKLVTVSSALLKLGLEHEFETILEGHGELRAGTWYGDLVLRGCGDPLYDEAQLGALTPWLDALARDLRALGIQAVQGRLVLDEGRFDPPGPGPGWPGAKSHWQEYCAFSGAFSANAGCFTALVTPGASGTQADVRLRPLDHGLRRRGSVDTQGKQLDVRVGATVSTVTVGGSIPAKNQPFEARFSHPDPVELFGEAVHGGLARRGIAVRDGFVRVSGSESPAPAQVLATLRSPWAPLMTPILRDSNNSLADQVFLHLGHVVHGDGSREGASRAVRAELTKLGVDVRNLVQVGGSGLSRDNRLPAAAITALLTALEKRGGPAFETFYAALPVSGESGTLKRRMKSGPAYMRVHAKTGFINGTSGLAGYIDTPSGRRLAFGLLVNYPHSDGLNTHCWKPMGDAICAALCE